MNEAMGIVPTNDTEETPQVDTVEIIESANSGAPLAPEAELAQGEVVETPEVVDVVSETPPIEEQVEAPAEVMTPIEHLVSQLPEVTNLGNDLNRVEKSDSRVTLETIPEVIETKEVVAEDILVSYQERFGINKEDLKGIEGFEKLSRGQQRQALENLAQLTIGSVLQQFANVATKVRMQQLRTTIHCCAEHGLGAIQLATHAGVLTSLPAEQKCNRPRPAFVHAICHRTALTA